MPFSPFAAAGSGIADAAGTKICQSSMLAAASKRERRARILPIVDAGCGKQA
jgi:hypothetical protein